MLNIKITNRGKQEYPEYATPQSAGMDIRADIPTTYTLLPMERFLVPTGLYMEIPPGFEAQIRPRSGLALKYGITVLNSPGTVDSDYRGEIGVILVNLSRKAFDIKPGERIAQMVFAAHEKAELIPEISLNDSERGANGFGHTGMS